MARARPLSGHRSPDYLYPTEIPVPTFLVPLGERAVLLEDGVPVRALTPGKHSYWLARGRSLVRFRMADVVFDAPPEVRAVLPSDWYDEVTLGARQRAMVTVDGRPVRFLRPGTHRYWTIDPSVEVHVFSVDEPVPELTDELRAIVPSGEIVDVTILQYQRGLKYVGGRFVALLEPGRHLMWSHADAKVHVAVIDTRLQQITVPGQDILTRDKVTVRLTLTVEYAPADLPATAHAAADVREALYLEAQLAARDHVASVSLDELLERRDGLTGFLQGRLVPRGKELGVSAKAEPD
jgi:regulator of protease activity HflC (stomatin/prohibitin superfamily)